MSEHAGPDAPKRTFVIALVATLIAAIAVTLTPSPADAGDGEVRRQEPFLCLTEFSGLGQPIVDNQEQRGTPVYPTDPNGTPNRTADPIGWSEDCQAPDRTTYHYRTTGGQLRELPADPTELPGDVMMLPVDELVGAEDMELGDATEIPYVLRYERGTLPEQRFMWSIAMLVPWAEVTGDVEPTHDHWNGRLVYSFDGGVAIGHSQGSLSTNSGTHNEAMQLGHAILYSSGTATSVHYNLLRGGLTAEETKATFVERHGAPRYTVGIGGSGGGIQQYIYGQNNEGVLDAAVPQYSYPDMTTQTIHTGDCELLEHYMDVTDVDNPRWGNWDNRRIVQGQNSIEGFTSNWQNRTGASGSSECIEGWRGLTPLAMNPRFGFASGMERALEPYLLEMIVKLNNGQPPVPDDFPDIAHYLRLSDTPVEWTHWDDVREVYGTDPATGYARVPWDNVGVQYGLRSVADGSLTPEEFLDLNARVGSWGEPEDAKPESCGLIDVMLGGQLAALATGVGLCEGEELDRHSARQMRLGDGTAPAPRRAGDLDAIRGAFEHDLVFQGEMPRMIPIIDARHYLEHRLDMHNVHQSWAARERITRAQGHHDNHLIWFLDARPSIDAAATTTLLKDGFRVTDEWMLNIEQHPTGDVVASKPPAAVDTCWDTDGTLIDASDDAWAGAEDLIRTGAGAWTDQPPTTIGGTAVGGCAQHFPLHSSSRIVAGAPITGDVYKCQTMPVQRAIADGMYGDWRPDAAARAQLLATHPDGVCDYALPGLGHPDTDPDEPFRFSDVAGPHAGNVDRVARARIADGFGDTTYRPNATITRGQMASFLARAVGLAPLPGTSFPDVTGGPHRAAINAVVEAGIAEGFEDGTFRPNAPVTRAQMASFIARALEMTDGPTERFSDVTGGPHRAAIELLAGAGIAEGWPDGTFRPGASVTRGQMASFVARGFLD
jgi:hypothetical protein